MNVRIVNHLIVSVGAILLFIAAFSGRGRRATLHVRVLLFLIGPVGVAWSIIGIYLIDHTTSQDHTTLPWAQFWMLDHIKSNLGGIGVGLLLALGVNPECYRRQRRATPTASNKSLEPTTGRRDV